MASSLVASLAVGQVYLVQYVESVLFALGTTGSFLNILLFSQRKLRSNSCCIYFLASSVAALVLILIGIIPQLYALDHNPDPLFNRDFCKARGYISQLSAMLCRWLLTIACVDRCLLTSINPRFHVFSTVHTARKVILVLSIIWLIFPIHVIIFANVRRSGYIVCVMSTSTAAFYHTIYTIIAGGLAPALIMLISTKLIWKSLRLKQQRRRRISLNTRQSKRETRDIQVLMMLLMQVIIFVVFTFPYMSFNLYLAFTQSVINKSIDRLAIESFLQLFTEVVVFVHPAISFYSNTLTSRTFRKEFILMLRRIFRCNHAEHFPNRNRIVPITFPATTTKHNDLPMSTVNRNYSIRPM